jgi:hypothetical protein
MRILKNLPLISIVFFWCFLGCGGIDLAVANENTLIIERFPAQVGNSWEYSRTFLTVFYDTLYTDTTQTVVIGSLHTEFQGIDTLRNWECYRYFSQLFEEGDTFSDIAWYAHPDTAFLKIAYGPPTHAGPPWKNFEKYRLKFGDSYFNTVEELSRYLYHMRNLSEGLESDTTFWDPPKKLFIFPLSVGKSWIATVNPWLDQREVTEETYVTVPAGNFLTLKIEIRYNGPNPALHEWISDKGVVKDSMYAQGLIIDLYGHVMGYFDAYDVYDLLDHVTEVNELEDKNSLPKDFSLGQNHPNPFNPTTKIQFKVGSLEFGRPLHTTLKIYNILEQLVKTLVDEEKLPGNYNIIWDGKDDSGKDVASGIYFYQLKTKDYTATKKMVLLR